MAPLAFCCLLCALLAAAAAPAAALTTLVARGAVWRYSAAGAVPGPGWAAPAFADAAWPAGPAPLGYGETRIRTAVPYGPDPADKHRTTYFRAGFDFAGDPTTLTGLTLLTDYDDGFVAYLNGQEIARRSLPAGTVAYETLASAHESGGFEAIDVTAAVGALVPGANLLAVEVHQTSPSSSDLVLDLELRAADGQPAVTRGPYLQRGTPTAVTVRWRTDAPTDSRVVFGTDPAALGSAVTDPAPTTEHEVVLAGLAPATRYYYAVGSAAAVLAGGDSSFCFVTAPPPGAPAPSRFWVIGDPGYVTAGAAAVRDAFLRHAGARGADGCLIVGDLAYTAGTDAEYQAAVFDQYREVLRRMVLWPTRGNHYVLYAGPNNDYYDHFTLPTAGEAGGVPSGSEAYYSFDHGPAHFVCLDSEGSPRDSSGAMVSWLRADLAANARPWVVAFWHHPPYTKGSHDSDDPADSGGRMRDMREQVLPVLEAAGVDLVLTGHSHSYERSYLLDGHYGLSTTLAEWMKADPGDGRLDGDGPYEKPAGPPATPAGAVHVVTGSACHVSGGPLDHPAMVLSENVLGSVVLDVAADRLDVLALDDAGAHRDSFTIVKGGAVAVGPGPAAPGLRLLAPSPNPVAAAARLPYLLPAAGRVELTVHDLQGRRVARVEAGWREAGRHEARWDGRDAAGRRLPAGVYFAVLRLGRESRAQKLVLAR